MSLFSPIIAKCCPVISGLEKNGLFPTQLVVMKHGGQVRLTNQTGLALD